MNAGKPALSLLEPLRPSFWMGPIFDKELRVTARHRRHYVLRLVYGLLLLIMMLATWVEVVPEVSRNGMMSARMADAGKAIVTLVVWFQFIGLQLVTVVTLSSAISEEIYRRTLPTLMTTPITSLQIVLGKLSSKLLQIILLYAMSWPLLAMVRVFGGVPWDYLLSTACMTLALVLFLSCLTLFYSVFFKRTYTVMIFSVLTAGVLFGLLPLLLVFLLRTSAMWQGRLGALAPLEKAIVAICPYACFWLDTQATLSPGFPWPSSPWPINCLVMLGLSLLLLVMACAKIRKAALRHVVARTARKAYKVPKTRRKRDILYRPLFLHNWIRRWWGVGMVWKEFLVPVLGRFRFAIYVASGILAGVFALGLTLTLWLEQLEFLGLLLTLLIFSFLVLAVLFTLLVPATAITAEKEARSWSILLTTRMTHGQILGGKLAGVLRRIALAWAPFCVVFGLLAFTLALPWPMVLQLAVIATTSIGFLVAVGLYLSTRFQRSTPSVVTGLSLLGILWGFFPFLGSVVRGLRYQWPWVWNVTPLRYFSQTAWNLTPVGLISEILNYSSLNTRRWYGDRDFISFGLIYLLLYGGGTLILLWRAKANIGRHR